jgi:hypothetical protein
LIAVTVLGDQRELVIVHKSGSVVTQDQPEADQRGQEEKEYYHLATSFRAFLAFLPFSQERTSSAWELYGRPYRLRSLSVREGREEVILL